MQDTLIMIQHLMNNCWAFVSSITVPGLDSITFADIFVSFALVNILSYLIRTFCFPDGGISFAPISNWSAQHNAYASAQSARKAQELEQYHNESAYRHSHYDRLRSGMTSDRKKAAVNRLTKK